MPEESASTPNEGLLIGSHAMSNWSWNMQNIQSPPSLTYTSNNLGDEKSIPSNASSSTSSTSGSSEDGGLGSGEGNIGGPQVNVNMNNCNSQEIMSINQL